MGDIEGLLAYAFGAVGLAASVMLVYVYKTASAFEVLWLKLNERTEKTAKAFQGIGSSVRVLRKEMDRKASYSETEKMLGNATSKMVLKGKEKQLNSLNKNIQVKVV
ncbi:hypothetical protein HZC09_04035 [Candidatus Micrarchaeota archaeon]|nr:hypothetical protein [Candidatus Micrarchaeota archaeon]